MSITEYANLQLLLLKEEKEEEIRQLSLLHSKHSPQELQKHGLCLVGLVVTGIRTGLGGKAIVDFEKESCASDQLPTHLFKNGDVIKVQEYSPKNSKLHDEIQNTASGIVFKITDTVVSISFKEELPKELSLKCNLTKMVNNITYDRMQDAIQTLKSRKDLEHNSLVRVLLGISDPTYDASLRLDDINLFDKSLNNSQKEAVRFAISSHNCAIIHGPPGTGKTYTLVEVIRQLVLKGDRVLVVGPSNLSVDNLVERLSKCKLDLIRLGHPARILPNVLPHVLDVRLTTCDSAEVIKDVKSDLDKMLKELMKKSKATNLSRKLIYQEIKQLKAELKTREKTLIKSMISNCEVILSTLNGCGSRILQYEEFDTVVIDEASQAMEAECWIALLKGKRVILAGDHMQLPPTVKSKTSIVSKSSDKNVESSLETTLMDRMLKKHGSCIKRLLDTQYRMNEHIMKFSSDEFYGGKLVAHDSVKDRLLIDLDNVERNEETESPLMLIDTTGCDYRESNNDGNNHMDESKYNEGEADLVQKHVEFLISKGVKSGDICIISPYSAQVKLLKVRLKEGFPELEIGTVDGFQGREKQVVILTLVRNNPEFEVGFLKESRRLNVALTRAKSHLVVVCDGEFLIASKDPVLKRMVEYFEENALIEYACN